MANAFDSPLRGELSSLCIVPRVPLRFTLGYFHPLREQADGLRME
jgi:hypothetical protein